MRPQRAMLPAALPPVVRRSLGRRARTPEFALPKRNDPIIRRVGAPGWPISEAAGGLVVADLRDHVVLRAPMLVLTLIRLELLAAQISVVIPVRIQTRRGREE